MNTNNGNLRGEELLRNPYLNKGLSFTMEERRRYGIEGLLPNKYETMDEQVDRLWEKIDGIDKNIDKYTFLENIRSSSLILFHSLLEKHFKELAPIVYTPTVGEGCIEFSRNPTTRNWSGSGIYINKSHKGKVFEILKNARDDIEIIVLTDGGRILGLGDLGINGMGIPIGKLSLYVTLGGIDPSKVLPISLDIGTNTNSVVEDKYYLGIKEKRIENEDYYPLMDEITESIFRRWPNVVLQWEDLTTYRAIDILELYKNKYRCFNDDIQGTASIVLAGILSSIKIAGKELNDQKILICGAGSASIGTVNLIISAMELNGITKEKAIEKFWLVDSKGLITNTRDINTLDKFKIPFIRKDINKNINSLQEIVGEVKPTILIGVSGQSGIFNEHVVKEMAKHTDRPIIFALSNPTSKAECTSNDVYNWTNGKVIFASGSPMKPVKSLLNNYEFVPSQCNNMYVFPGIGLAAKIGKFTRIPDVCFIQAANTVSKFYNKECPDILFPPLTASIGREISANIAADLIILAKKNNFLNNDTINTTNRDDLVNYIKDNMWLPNNQH